MYTDGVFSQLLQAVSPSCFFSLTSNRGAQAPPELGPTRSLPRLQTAGECWLPRGPPCRLRAWLAAERFPSFKQKWGCCFLSGGGSTARCDQRMHLDAQNCKGAAGRWGWCWIPSEVELLSWEQGLRWGAQGCSCIAGIAPSPFSKQNGISPASPR